MVHLVLLLLVAAPTHTKYDTKLGVISFNVERLCMTKDAVDRVLEIAREELSKSCKDWTDEKTKSALKGAQLYWRSASWMQKSESCLDVPQDRQQKNADGTVSCLVDGLQYSNKMFVYFNGVWDDTLPHEMAHLFQTAIDGKSDPRHTGYVKDGCIDKALKSTLRRYNLEMYSVEKYGCDLSTMP